jgi:hypothetical protein
VENVTELAQYMGRQSFRIREKVSMNFKTRDKVKPTEIVYKIHYYDLKM